MDLNYTISLNQMVEFTRASAAKKIAITKQQIKANPFLLPWYQLAKHRIKKYFHDTTEPGPILEAIEILKARKPSSVRGETDRKVSMEALTRMIHLSIPRYLKGLDYQVIKSPEKSVQVGEVKVNVNPDVIIRTKINGKTVYGGMKIHLCKHKPFELGQCYYSASLIHKFLAEKVAKPDEIVSPELCFCLDVFGGRLVSSPLDYATHFEELKEHCVRFCEIWDELKAE